MPKKYLHKISMFAFTHKRKFPGLPNLGAQIRYAKNRYTAVQMHLKYPQGYNFIISVKIWSLP